MKLTAIGKHDADGVELREARGEPGDHLGARLSGHLPAEEASLGLEGLGEGAPARDHQARDGGEDRAHDARLSLGGRVTCPEHVGQAPVG